MRLANVREFSRVPLSGSRFQVRPKPTLACGFPSHPPVTLDCVVIHRISFYVDE
jgi:hypothetical protein